MTTEKGIWIITSDADTFKKDDHGKSVYDTGPDYLDELDKANYHQSRVSAEVLKANMGEFIEVIQETFDEAEKKSSILELDEIELSVEINGEGQVGLWGIGGGKVGGKGAIKLKFKRRDQQ